MVDGLQPGAGDFATVLYEVSAQPFALPAEGQS